MKEKRPLRVLIVDDSSLMRTFIREAVESISKEIEIYGAATGEAAWDYLHKMPFDLVLCDWNMPRMNGSELLHFVRENEKIKDTPFIMITAQDDKELVVKLLKQGVKDYIIKPVSIDVLIARIRKVLYGPAPVPVAGDGCHPEPMPEPENQPALKLAADSNERLGKIMRKFVDSCRDVPRELDALLARGDMEGAVRMAHTIKGNAGMVGAAGLQQAARRLEEALKAADDHQRDETLAWFRRELQLVIESVDNDQSQATEVQHGDPTS